MDFRREIVVILRVARRERLGQAAPRPVQITGQHQHFGHHRAELRQRNFAHDGGVRPRWPWGVQSILVEPGIYRTPIMDKPLAPSDAARLASYGPHAAYADTVKAVFAAAMADPANPGASEVGDAIVRLIEMAPAERPFRTVVSPPLVPMLAPYNDMAESHRAIVAGIFGVPHLVGAGGKG
jgi:hypothetical protein